MCGTSLHFGTGIDQQEGIGGHVGSHNFDSGVSFSISREIHTPTTTPPVEDPPCPLVHSDTVPWFMGPSPDAPAVVGPALALSTFDPCTDDEAPLGCDCPSHTVVAY